MRKITLIIAGIGILTAAIPAAAQTSPDFHKFSIGGGGGYMSTSKYGSGVVFGGSLAAGLTKNIGIELRGSYFQGDVAGEASGLSKGKFTTIPIQLSLQFRYPVGDKLVPYFGGGAGYYMNDFALDASVVSKWSDVGFTISETMDPCIGFHFGGGLDFLFAPKIIVNLDVRYALAKTAGAWKLVDENGAAEASGTLDNLEINPLAATLSIRYGF
ncbi:MAG: OmpW family outer membrane protein [Acidobacteriota bacterium]|nr:OmpW family outer membrane protein [Acidobacteriota bacterium]